MMDVTAVSHATLPDGRPIPLANFTDGLFETNNLAGDPQLREVASQLSRWVDNNRNARGRSSMFDRGAYTPPDNPYDEMRAAKTAFKYDSIVSGVAEVTEAFAFQGVKWEGPNADEADVFNQIAATLKLDKVVRNMWRDEYQFSQFIAAKLWGWQEYTVRGKTVKGNKKKKRYRVWAPQRIVMLDPLKVVPVGHGPLREDRLAWHATPGEVGGYQMAFKGDKIDPLMVAFFDGTYIPDEDEAAELAAWGVDPTRLLMMNQDWVFRHTDTRPDYQKFADLRLKSVFKLLDLKNQLMAADRASLIGAANYILLIRKGTDEKPATQDEITNLKENYSVIAKLPVIISDHRLEIEIICPKVDLTLMPEKYDVLDRAILNRMLGTLGGDGNSEGAQSNIVTSVAQVVSNRRHMLARTIEFEVAHAVVNHPKNRGLFETEPNLVYTPRNINLGDNSTYAQGLLALRSQREISRETTLEFYGIDQETEFLRMEIEQDLYDDVFMSGVPFTATGPGQPGATTKDGANKNPTSQPASGQPSTGQKKTSANGGAESTAVSGARGGRPKGGGTATQSPAKTAKPRTATGSPSTAKK